MTEPVDIALTFPAGMNDSDVKALLTAVQEHFEIVDDGGSNFSPDWMTVIALLKDGAQIIGGLSALASLANKLIDWRAKTAKAGRPTSVRIKMSGRREIDLQCMSDAEVRLVIESGGK
jgi:hypothetical protein